MDLTVGTRLLLSPTEQASSDNAQAVGMMAENFAKKGWHFAQMQQKPGGSGGRSPFGTRAFSTHAR